MKILVTGGAGYTRSHVCKVLPAAVYTPIFYGNLVYGHRSLVVALVIWIGSTGGPEGMARAMFRLMMGLFKVGWPFLVHPTCEASMAECTIAAPRRFVVAIFAVLPAYELATLLNGAVLSLAAAVFVAAPLYLVLSHFTNHQRMIAVRELVHL
jgi:hypothetical protein